MSIMSVAETLEIRQCPTCFIYFASPREMMRRYLENGGTWHCPAGHGIHFTTPEVERLRNELEKAQREAINTRTALTAERADRERLYKRANNGVCPHCHRTFVQVRAHIARKHKAVAPK